MSAVGIDFGTSKIVVGVAQKGGVDICLNEMSDRFTPTVLSFGDSRLVGESAASAASSNIKSTIFNIKDLIGRRPADEYTNFLRNTVNYDILEESESAVLKVRVQDSKKQRELAVEQLIGSIFQNLKKMLQNVCTTTDCAISVPYYFTERQRRIVAAGAQIAGWNVLRLVSDPAATILQYGIYKMNLKDEVSHKGIFIDIGGGNTQIAVADIGKLGAKLLAVTADSDIGGERFNKELYALVCQKIESTIGVDITRKPRAALRVMKAVEKCKRVLSSNSEALIQIEMLTDDKDFTFMVKR